MRVCDAIGAAVDALAAAGVETPRLDAEVLIADALGLDRGQLLTERGRTVTGAAARLIGERVRRRVAREPVAYILGRKGFRYVEVGVDARVLIPRPETELLVELALELPRAASVHEVGVGSGAVAIAVATERPDLHVSGSDISAEAVDVASANARAAGVRIDLAVADGVPNGHRDLVLANLPYVREDEWDTLAPEIRAYEPRLALLAGVDGLDAIRRLLAGCPPGQRVALEHAPAQAAAVRALLGDAATHPDLAGRPRVTTGAARGAGTEEGADTAQRGGNAQGGGGGGTARRPATAWEDTR